MIKFDTSNQKEFMLDEEGFFRAFPQRPADAHKGSTGRVLLVSGSYGMAGAVSLNILGAKAIGAPYIMAAIPEEIYTVVASESITTVYLPYKKGKGRASVMNAPGTVTAAAIGSGGDNNPDLEDILQFLLFSTFPLVLDVAALKLIQKKQADTCKREYPLIITPHLGEFAALYPEGADLVQKDPVKAAFDCSVKYGVITVLKGPNTAVASPEGKVYVNNTGNQGLAQAGSGDVLTGMITAMLSFIKDPFEAACMGVFAHGMAADRLCRTHAKQTMPLEKIPEAMDRLFFEHGF